MTRTGGIKKHARRSILLRTAVAFLATISSTTYSAIVSIHTDQTGTSCALQAPPVQGNLNLYVFVKWSSGSTGAQFKFEIDSSPYTVSAWTVPPAFLSFGSPESGVGVSFGSCLVGDYLIGTLVLQRTGDPLEDCGMLRITSHPDALTGAVELADCSFQIAAVNDACFWLVGDDKHCAYAPTPSDPSPPDGAMNVALDAAVNASIHDPDFCCPFLYGEWVDVYFGTTPDPPRVPELLPYDPILAPATKYYWKVIYHNTQAPSVSSPVWSFTTESTTPVTPSTWGAIKALYR